MNLVPFLIFISLAYLLGSIPFGLIVARSRGIDIRSVGSGNIGATNVLRSVGKSWGILTLFLDALKGLIPSALFPAFAGIFSIQILAVENPDILQVVCGCAAVLGHNFPIFLKFKGGKGVATTAGALIGIAPAALGIGLIAFLLTFAISRMVSMGSIIAAATIPVAAWLLYRGQENPALIEPIVLTALGLLAIWRHKSNIGRILKGQETRIKFGKKKSNL